MLGAGPSGAAPSVIRVTATAPTVVRATAAVPGGAGPSWRLGRGAGAAPVVVGGPPGSVARDPDPARLGL